jgi:hypothetical protein
MFTTEQLIHFIENGVKAQRAETFAQSEQLSLGEFVLKLEHIQDKTKFVYFADMVHIPTELDSWRGIYNELALNYTKGDFTITVEKLLTNAKEAVGKEFIGYKGGKFIMRRATPIWIANDGCTDGFLEGKEDTEEEFYSQALVDVLETEKEVLLITKLQDC